MAASFKRTDERALAARRSSYAFLKQSEEVVPWAPLSVQGELVSDSHSGSGGCISKVLACSPGCVLSCCVLSCSLASLFAGLPPCPSC